MAHANARTNLFGRLLIVERQQAGWPQARQLGLSRATGCKWLTRWRGEGLEGLADRSSRPKSNPRRVSARVLTMREKVRRGAVFLAGRLRMNASTVGRILARNGVARLSATNPITDLPVRRRATEVRYERDRPGDLVHVDVKKLRRIPDSGGWRLHGHRHHSGGPVDYDCIHVADDGDTHLAYVEALPNEKDATSAGFLRRATAWFADRAVRIERPRRRAG